MFWINWNAVRGWLASRSGLLSELVSQSSDLDFYEKASQSASNTWGLSSVSSTLRSLRSSVLTWGSGLMNLGTTWWVRPLILVMALAASFGAGMIVEARWTTEKLIEQQQETAEKVASALTAKMKDMTDAAIKSAAERTERERALELQVKQVIKEAEDAANNQVGLPAGSVRALNRLRKQAPRDQ
jgi:hypothetical protein